MTAPELAELIGGTIKLKRMNPTTWQGFCPKHRDRHPSFWVFVGESGHGMFGCHPCRWFGNEITWRKYVGDDTRVELDRQAVKNHNRERAEALFRIQARPAQAMPEEDAFTQAPTKLDALRRQMADRLGWKS